MTAMDHFWMFVILAASISAWVAALVDRRRKRSMDDFRRRHLDRKTEVERDARRSL